MEKPVIKPEHRKAAKWALVGVEFSHAAVLDAVERNVAEAIATVEARVRLELADDARQYRELVSQLELIYDTGHCGSAVMTPLGIELWARELGWKPCPGAKEEP